MKGYEFAMFGPGVREPGRGTHSSCEFSISEGDVPGDGEGAAALWLI
jgi:hypothetical protein